MSDGDDLFEEALAWGVRTAKVALYTAGRTASIVVYGIVVITTLGSTYDYAVSAFGDTG